MENTNFKVVLGEYKGLHYTEPQVSVSDDEVEYALQQERLGAAKMVTVGKAAQNGDTVVIDYAGFCNDVQFPGGTSDEPYPLVLGSHSFIPGFEEQLVGAVAGESRDVTVTFPEVYHEPSLAGKPAVFKCKVHAVQQQELPALGDAFAQERYGLSTIAELRTAIRNSIASQKKDQETNKIVSQLVAKIVETSEITLSEEYLAENIAQMHQYFNSSMQQQGASAELYCQYNGITVEQLNKQLEAEATVNARNVAVMTAVADAEGIELTDEEFNNEISRMAQQYRMMPEQLLQSIPEEQLAVMRDGLRTTKAVDFIMANSIAD